MITSDNELLNQLDSCRKKERKQGLNAKTKGKRGESYFAEQLSKISGLHFHRIFASGAAVGKSNASKLEVLTQNQAEAQLGDIQSPEDLEYLYIWESKNYEDLDFHNLISLDFSTKVIGWLEEVEYDLESALYRMKGITRVPIGFLCIKITRKGSWIVGNIDYLNKIFKGNIQFNFNHLRFYHTPKQSLIDKGYGKEYFMVDFTNFIEQNSKILFKIDQERMKRLETAKAAFQAIMDGNKEL